MVLLYQMIFYYLNVAIMLKALKCLNERQEEELPMSTSEIRPISPSKTVSIRTMVISCLDCFLETLKCWVAVQLDQSYLMGIRYLFSLGWPPF